MSQNAALDLLQRFGWPVALIVISAWVGRWFGARQKKDDLLTALQVSVAGVHDKMTMLVAEVSAIRRALEEKGKELGAVTVMVARLEERVDSLDCARPCEDAHT